VRTQFAQWLGLGAGRPDLVVRLGRGPQLPDSQRRSISCGEGQRPTVSELCQNPIYFGHTGLLWSEKQMPQVIVKKQKRNEAIEGLEFSRELAKQVYVAHFRFHLSDSTTTPEGFS
jgi:hypothetical protein